MRKPGIWTKVLVRLLFLLLLLLVVDAAIPDLCECVGDTKEDARVRAGQLGVGEVETSSDGEFVEGQAEGEEDHVGGLGEGARAGAGADYF